MRLQHSEVKGNRIKDDSYSYRGDSIKHIRRMIKRRGKKGWGWFDFYKRPTNNPADSQVLETLNYFPQYAVEKIKPKIKKREKMTWTNIRHTAFVLMVQANPDLRDPTELAKFAANGFTSVQMFNDTYLKKLDIEESAFQCQAKR